MQEAGWRDGVHQALILAYWVARYAHRSLVASETTVVSTQFEGAFPLADGWLTFCLVAGSYCLLTERRAALFWLLTGGGAGIYLFCTDVPYDLEHGIWGKDANGVVELVINLVTLALSLFVLRWTWVRRHALGTGEPVPLRPGTESGPSVRADSSHPPDR